MTGSKRGFSRERHGPLKLAASLVALFGFGGSWVAFGHGLHGRAAAEAASTSLADSAPAEVPSTTASPREPYQTPTAALPSATPVHSFKTYPRPRVTRGS